MKSTLTPEGAVFELPAMNGFGEDGSTIEVKREDRSVSLSVTESYKLGTREACVVLSSEQLVTLRLALDVAGKRT